MTDKELMIAAAKSAGLEIKDGENGGLMRRGDRCWFYWDPLNYSGDAFDLVVLAGLDVVVFPPGKQGCNPDRSGTIYAYPPDHDGDRPPSGRLPLEDQLEALASARRVIVTAAASMGAKP